jgi:hypothetical protein
VELRLLRLRDHVEAEPPGRRGLPGVRARLITTATRAVSRSASLAVPSLTSGLGGRGTPEKQEDADARRQVEAQTANILTLSQQHLPDPAGAAALPDTDPAAASRAVAIEVDQEPAGRRVRLRGRLDAATAPELEATLAPRAISRRSAPSCSSWTSSTT